MPVSSVPEISSAPSFAKAAEKVAEQHRAIQRKIDAAEKKGNGKSKSKKPPQTGAREYPAPPFPEQHLAKPGFEADLELKPMYDAPHYKGSDKLKDKVALITGGDSGIGRSVAVLYAREGADIAIAYLNEHEDAAETKRAVEAEGRRCILLSGDVADPEFCEEAVSVTIKKLGKLDILVNNAAFQEHVPDFEMLTEEHFDRTLKTNLYGYFHMAKAAVPHMKEGSAIVMNGSVTGYPRQRRPARLFDDQGRHPRFRALACVAPDRSRHPRQRGGARAGLDAAQSRRQTGEEGRAIWQ